MHKTCRINPRHPLNLPSIATFGHVRAYAARTRFQAARVWRGLDSIPDEGQQRVFKTVFNGERGDGGGREGGRERERESERERKRDKGRERETDREREREKQRQKKSDRESEREREMERETQRQLDRKRGRARKRASEGNQDNFLELVAANVAQSGNKLNSCPQLPKREQGRVQCAHEAAKVDHAHLSGKWIAWLQPKPDNSHI